jgi:hypothetical protein
MQALGYVGPQNAAWSAENLAGRGLEPGPTYRSSITEWRRFCGHLSKGALCKPGVPRRQIHRRFQSRPGLRWPALERALPLAG